jgi:hypothetical protein
MLSKPLTREQQLQVTAAVTTTQAILSALTQRRTAPRELWELRYVGPMLARAEVASETVLSLVGADVHNARLAERALAMTPQWREIIAQGAPPQLRDALVDALTTLARRAAYRAESERALQLLAAIPATARTAQQDVIAAVSALRLGRMEVAHERLESAAARSGHAEFVKTVRRLQTAGATQATVTPATE